MTSLDRDTSIIRGLVMPPGPARTYMYGHGRVSKQAAGREKERKKGRGIRKRDGFTCVPSGHLPNGRPAGRRFSLREMHDKCGRTRRAQNSLAAGQRVGIIHARFVSQRRLGAVKGRLDGHNQLESPFVWLGRKSASIAISHSTHWNNSGESKHLSS